MTRYRQAFQDALLNALVYIELAMSEPAELWLIRAETALKHARLLLILITTEPNKPKAGEKKGE